MPLKPKAAVIIAEPKPDESDKGKIIVPAPDGLDTEGKKPGETFDAVCEFEIEDDGKLCLKKINGIEMGGYEGDQKEQEGPPENTFAGAVTGQPEE